MNSRLPGPFSRLRQVIPLQHRRNDRQNRLRSDDLARVHTPRYPPLAQLQRGPASRLLSRRGPPPGAAKEASHLSYPLRLARSEQENLEEDTEG